MIPSVVTFSRLCEHTNLVITLDLEGWFKPPLLRSFYLITDNSKVGSVNIALEPDEHM